MAKPLSKTVVVAYGRSAVAKSGKKGALRNLHPIDMGGLVLKGVMEKIPTAGPRPGGGCDSGLRHPGGQAGPQPRPAGGRPGRPALHRLRPYRGPLLFILSPGRGPGRPGRSRPDRPTASWPEVSSP